MFTPVRRIAALSVVAAAVLGLDATKAAAQADAGSSFDFLSPPRDSMVGPLLYVTVDVAVAVTGVHARAGTVEFDLKPMGRAWSGSADISSLPRGPQTVVVTATSSSGETLSATLPVVHDDAPIITITTPLHADVARPDLHVVATCHDDDTPGCLNFKATVGTRSVTATSSIDTVFPLGAEDGQQTALEVTATDSSGQTVYERRDIYVDSSSSLVPVVSVDGQLFDVDAARAIYLRLGSVVVRDRKTLADVVVGDMDPHVAETIGAEGQIARLTEAGAVWLARGGFGGSIGCTNVTAFAWRGGQATKFFDSCGEFLRMNGDYFASYAPGDTTRVTLQNLATGVATNVPVGVPGDPVVPAFDLAVGLGGELAGIINGPTADLSSCPVVRSQNGRLVPLAGTLGCGQAPIYDGVNVVYTARGQMGCRTMLVDRNGSAVALADLPQCLVSSRGYQANRSGGAYAVAGGWTAFLKPTASNVEQVWVLTPDYASKRIETLGSSSTIEGISPAGEVMFTNGGHRYLGSIDHAPVRVSSSLGFPTARCGHWAVIIGNTAFQLAGADAGADFGCAPDEPDAGNAGDANESGADANPADVGIDGAADASADAGSAGAGGGGGASGAGGGPSDKDASKSGGAGGLDGSTRDAGATAPGMSLGVETSSGCGCRVATRQAGRAYLACMALALGLARRIARRRRRRRAC